MAFSRLLISVGNDPSSPYLDLEDDDSEVRAEDGMVFITTVIHGQEVEILIQPSLYGRITEVIASYNDRGV